MYNFSIIGIAHKSINRCWQEGVYVDALRHRFWKLNLQLINFVENYVRNIDWNKLIVIYFLAFVTSLISPQRHDDSKHEDEAVKSGKLIHIKTLLLMDLYRFLKISSMELGDPAQNDGLVWIYRNLLLPTLDDDSLSDSDRLCIQETLHDSNKKIVKVMADIILSIQSTLMVNFDATLLPYDI